MIKKSLLFFFVLLVLSSFCFAVTGQVSSFTGQTNPFNITFVGNQNQSFIIPLPQYGYAQNVSLEIKTINSSSLSYDNCTQQFTNVSTVCGGKNSGGYENNLGFNPQFAVDGDYSTSGRATGGLDQFLYINISLPDFFIIGLDSLIYQSKIATINYQNFTILSDCINSTARYTRIEVLSAASANYVRLRCFNFSSSNYEILWQGTAGDGSDYYDSTFYFLRYITNFSIYSENGLFYNSTLRLYSNVSLNISVVNSLLSSNQPINLTFRSDTAGILQVNLTNATYSYGIDSCVNSFGIPSNATMMNFTSLYEGNNSQVNVDITTGSFLTYKLSGLTTPTSIFPIASNINNLTYCGYPAWSKFNVDYSIKYAQAGTTNTRQKAGSEIPISNILTTLPLYVLSSSTAVTITLTVTDTFSVPISGVNVIVTRTIAGVDYTVQTAVTGDDGVVSLFLDSTQSYTITASKEGFSTSSKTINYPSIANIYTLQLSTATTTVQPFSAGISYSFLPSGVLSNGTTYNFIFNLSSTYWQITSCDFTLLNGAAVLSTVGGTFNSSRCGASISLLIDDYSNVTSRAVYGVNGTSQTVERNYLVTTYTQGNYSFQTIIDDLSAFTDAGFNWQAKMLIALIVIIGLTVVFSAKFNMLINPEPGLIFQCVLVLLFSIMGWLTIPDTMFNFPNVWGTVSAGQYAIFILDLLMTLGYVLWRHS